ncbi:MAG: glycosyltransferase [Pirellulales bacterium]
MNTCWLIAWIPIAVFALVQSALMVLHLYEHHRFARGRIAKPREIENPRRVAVFAPCKGLDLELEDNLRPLLEQDYPDYQVTFIVQGPDDPACRAIRRLIDEHPRVAARLLVAGNAVDTGQKVHNLLVATRQLDREVEILAFVDSDARPRRDWLRQLVQRLDRPGVGAATGYRWFVPVRARQANYLLHNINSCVAGMLGPGGHHLVWGGSWAIRRDVFEAMGLGEAWRRTLSDDLVAARLLHENQMFVEFEPACMLASPLDHTWRQTLTFLRRQYMLARVYVPRWWLLGFTGTSVAMLAFWGGLVLTAGGLVSGASWTGIPAMISLAYYVLSIVHSLMRQRLATLYASDHAAAVSAAVRWGAWIGPIAGLANWLVMVSSLVGRRLTWRGITYRLGRGGRVRLVRRLDAAAKTGEPLVMRRAAVSPPCPKAPRLLAESSMFF